MVASTPALLASWLLMLTLCPMLRSTSAEGSCRKSKLCCPGRDSSCVVQKAPINAIIEDLSDKPCFCDHACMKLGDCCQDFKDACGVTDCEVSDWGSWSTCSTDCGSGSMSRDRKILRQPENGGHHCPDVLQKRGCWGTQCGDPQRARVKTHRETALLLPGRYSQIRNMNATNDIRKNLRLRYPKDPAMEGSKDYCVVFEVSKSRKTCESADDEATRTLQKGAKICVTCETAAMRKHLGYRCKGHGTEGKPTRWASLAFPQCHGRWVKKEVVDGHKCPCHQGDGKPDFIFV